MKQIFTTFEDQKSYNIANLEAGTVTYSPIDGNLLESEIKGYTVIGVESIDHPMTDGLEIHLLSPDRQRSLVLYVGVASLSFDPVPDISEAPLEIEVAEIP